MGNINLVWYLLKKMGKVGCCGRASRAHNTPHPAFLSLCVFFFIVLTACQPTRTVAPASPTPGVTTTIAASAAPQQTVTPAPSQTLIPPTNTDTPTSTATRPIVMSPTPRGALTWEQERLLYAASQRYLAETEDTANQIVRQQIDYLSGDVEDVSLVCGPLSAILLREAGVLPPDTNLHAFWLLDPRTRTNQITLETYFPQEHFAWYHFDTPMHEFDFVAFPLLPGDFLYLYYGSNGTFEHMITVTKVDEQGRAYTVSNLNTNEGFVIRELMLYDPARPGVGQIYDWANFELNKWLGLTGGGGFGLWRLIKP